MPHYIDLNCDMGESPAGHMVGNDATVMPYISSANIACGGHAGDAAVMRETVRLAKLHGIAIGAHPSWHDMEGFGRREQQLLPGEVEELVTKQIRALAVIADQEGMQLTHVKPHGALYNQAAKDAILAHAIAHAVRSINASLVLVGLAGSELISAGQAAGLRTANEGFPDRGYMPDGTLTPRTMPGALLATPELVAAHAVSLAQDGISINGRVVRADTLCLHGDYPNVAGNAKAVRLALETAGYRLQALNPESK